jgi:hypothetical protein
MVPVGLDGSGLVPSDVISVAPSGIPVGPMGWPETLLSGEVVPIVAEGSIMPPTCATAGLHRRSVVRLVMMNETLTELLRSTRMGMRLIYRSVGRRFTALHDNAERSAQDQPASGRLTTIGVGVLRTTTHRNASVFDGLISMCGR